jgi:hypothetical protein
LGVTAVVAYFLGMKGVDVVQVTVGYSFKLSCGLQSAYVVSTDESKDAELAMGVRGFRKNF